jgi:D-alanyl-D-alanine-carboxypeptidase/D-alanyl-D-alanine-endopeptidase
LLQVEFGSGNLQELILVFLSSTIAGIISPDVPNGQTLLFAGGDTLWNTQYQPLKLNGDTLFEIGSITKVFTSQGWYHCHKTYDDFKLGDFITAVALNEKLSDLTIKELANYSPGFPTDHHVIWWNPPVTQSLPNLLDFLQASLNLPQNPPGTCYSYSNFGWGLLGLASVSVSSYSDDVLRAWTLLMNDVTSYAHMSTRTAPYNSSMNASLPVGYNQNWEILPLNHNYVPCPLMLMGAGYLVSTGNDMMQWLRFNMGLQGIYPEFSLQQQPIWTYPQCPQNNSEATPMVSLGWFHHVKPNHETEMEYLAKDGGVAGFTSWMSFQSWVDAEEPSSIGCFVLTNSHGASTLGEKIMNLLLGLPDSVVVPVEPDYVPSPE